MPESFRFAFPGHPVLVAAMCLALGHALPQRLMADHTVTETATGTWYWVGTTDDPFKASATISGTVLPRPDYQTLTAETLSYSDHVSVSYTLELKEHPPLGEGWVRQGAAPAPPQIRVTRNANLLITIGPKPGDVAPTVTISWNGLYGGTLSTTVDRPYSSTQSSLFPGPSYTATGDLTGQIALPSVYAGSASLFATFGYTFAMEGVSSGTSTYTRQVPGSHSSVPEPREWAMMAGLPLAAFACARRLRPHRRQR